MEKDRGKGEGKKEGGGKKEREGEREEGITVAGYRNS